MGQLGAVVVAMRRRPVQPEAGALAEHDRTTGKPANAKLGSLEVGQDADRPADGRLDLANRGVEARDLAVIAMAHVQPEDVGARGVERADHLWRLAGRAKRGDDADAA